MQLLAEQQKEDTSGNQFPFALRTIKVLTAFAGIMEGFIARSQELNLVDLFDMVVEGSGYKRYISGLVDGEERWENMLELRTVLQDYRDIEPPQGLTTFLEEITLVADVDGLDSSVDAVTFITLHQAKGLEFPVVFMVGMEDGILPHFRSIDDPEQLEEERRLCYVGITRAKQRVYLVRAFRRSLMGSSMVNKPSRFLQDIPSHLVTGGGGLWSGEDSRVANAVYYREKAPAPKFNSGEYEVGEHVLHAQFGEGVVVSCRAVRDDVEVVVAFDGGGVKRLLLSFAPLEKA